MKSRLVKLISIAVLSAVGALNLVSAVRATMPENLGHRDFSQDYLLGTAILGGVNPYLPLPELAAKFDLPVEHPNHPSPHPPSFAVLSVPLALFSHRQAAVLWLAFGVTSLIVSLHLLFRLSGLDLAFGTLAALAWVPVFTDLEWGQLMTPMLMLLVLAWAALRSGRDAAGGLLLGLAISIKLMAWPLILLLLLRKRFSAAVAAVALFAALNMAAVAVIGAEPFLHYFFRVSKIVTRVYAHDPDNYSAATVGWKLFEGTRSAITVAPLSAPPLVYAPAVAPAVSYGLALALTATAVFFAYRVRDFDVSFAILVGASIVLGPVAWVFFLTLALFPLAIIARRMTRVGFGLVAFLSAVPVVPLVVKKLFGEFVPFGLGVLCLAPLAAVLLLLWHVTTLDGKLPDET